MVTNTYIKKKEFKEPNFIPQEVGEQTKPKVSRRKEIIKIMAERSEIENIKNFFWSTELRDGFWKR